MADPAGTSIFATIGRWFGKEPAVAVAAFGKCSTANGHQDVAGDSTRGMLETARRLYYEAALPNGRTWESELRAADRVLARTVVRWTADRAFVCRLIPVAEGGSDATGFAPLVACVEIDSTLALAQLAAAMGNLKQVEGELSAARPTDWPAILRPVRDRMSAETERLRTVGSARTAVVAAESVRRTVRGLGRDAGRWFASLAEELGLPLRSHAESPKVAPPSGSRAVSAPRVNDGLNDSSIDGDVADWCGLLVAAGLAGREFWILGADDSKSLRLIAGHARDRDLHALWRSREAAMEVPVPLSDRTVEAHRSRVEAWLASLGIAPTPSWVGFAPPPSAQSAESLASEARAADVSPEMPVSPTRVPVPIATDPELQSEELDLPVPPPGAERSPEHEGPTHD